MNQLSAADPYLAGRRHRHGRGSPLPGKTFAAYLAGYHLTPENRYGTITFRELLT